MTATQHTPGPWHWDADPIKGDPLNRMRCRITAIGKTITQCYYGSSDPHYEADARLIAAAPDLLDLLRALSRDCRTYEYPDSSFAVELLEKADALIDKVMGTSE